GLRPPPERRKQDRLCPGAVVGDPGGGGDTGIFICQWLAYLEQSAVQQRDLAAARGTELLLGELDALVDRVRRDPELAPDLLRGLVLDQQVEHLTLLGRQASQHELDL